MRHVLAGEDTMRINAGLYIRRPEGMTDDTEWANYVLATPFFEATGRTHEGLTGMAFAEPPIINVPAAMDPIKDDITNDGHAVHGFAEQLFDEVMAVGRVGLLVDHPKPDPRVRTRRDEELLNVRPYASIYQAEQIINWRTTKFNGRRQLVQVRLKEIEVEETANFETETTEYIRVLGLENRGGVPTYFQQRYRYDATKKQWIEDGDEIIPLMNNQPLPYIPFWFINARDLTDKMLNPPLLALANTNVSHFNTNARYENALSFCGCPQPYITGYEETQSSFRIGSSEAWAFPNPDTKVDYLTLGADGISPLKDRIEEHEQHMALLGARMLAPDKKAAETAETAQIHRQGETSVLKSAANTTSKALTEALRCIAEWMGIKDKLDEISVKLHTDFFDAPMTGGEAAEYMRLWQAGVIAFGDLLIILKRGKVLGSERNEEAIASENQSGLIQPTSKLLSEPTKTQTE